jgi:hypothetical protein
MADDPLDGVGIADIQQAIEDEPALSPIMEVDAPPIMDSNLIDSQEFKDIVSEVDSAVSAWEPHLLKLEKLNKAYLNVETSSDNPYPRKLGSSRKIYNAVKVLSSRASNALLSADRMMGLKPYRIQAEPQGMLSDQEKNAQIGMEIGNYILSLSNYKRTLCEKTFIDFPVYANPYLMVAITKGPQGLIIPHISRVSPFLAWPDPTVDDIDDAEYVARGLVLSKVAFEHLITQRIIDKTQAAKCHTATATDFSSHVRAIREERKQQDTLPDSKQEKYYLVEDWKYMIRKGDKEPRLYWIIFDMTTKTLLRFRPAPFAHGKIPIVRGNYMPVPESLNGLGVAEALWGLQREFNRYRAQAGTNAGLISNLSVLLARTSGIDKDSILQNAIGRVIMGNQIDPGNVRQLEFRSALNELSAMMSFIDQDIQTTGPANDMSMAVKAPNTAKAAEIMAGQNQLNLDLFTIMASYTLLQPVLEQVWSNIQTFTNVPIWSKLGAKVVTAADLQGEFQVEVGDFLEKARAQTVAKALITTMAMAGQTGVPGDYPYLVQKILIGEGLSMDEAEKAFPQTGVMTPRVGAQPGGVPGQNAPNQMGVPPPEGAPGQGIQQMPGGLMALDGGQQ